MLYLTAGTWFTYVHRLQYLSPIVSIFGWSHCGYYNRYILYLKYPIITVFSHQSRIRISDCHCTDQHSWRNAWLLALMKFSSKVTTTLFSVAGRAPVGRSETKLCSPFRVNPFNNFWAKFSVLIPFVSGSHIVSELGRFGGQNLPHSPFAMSF